MSAPQVYRPAGTRYVAYGAGAALVILTTVIGFALPSYVYFSFAELLTLALTLGGALAVLHGMGRSRVTLSDDAIEVVNGYRRHHVAWSEARGVAYPDGAPWPILVTGDDERIMLFALQSSSGRGHVGDVVGDIARRCAEAA